MIERLAGDGHTQIIHVGEIRSGQVSGMMHLGKHHRLVRTAAPPPLVNPPLERSPLRVGKPTWVLILQPAKQRDGLKFRLGFQPRFDLGPDLGERVRSRSIPP